MSLATQASLSNFEDAESGLDSVDAPLGALKKEVMLLRRIFVNDDRSRTGVTYAFCFGFLASAVTRSAAFRFSDIFVAEMSSFDMK